MLAPLTVDSLTSPAQLRVEQEGWDRLALAHPDPFSSVAWLASWWEAFAASTPGAVVVARRGGELAGGLALLEGGAPMANEHCPVFRPLAGDDEARAALLEAGIAAGGGRLRLPALPADDPAAAWPRAVLAPRAISPIVDTSGSFGDWRALSRPRWGAPLERFRRKMGREHGLVMRLNQPPEDLGRELERGFAVEASGWKGRAGTAIVSRPETERFYRSMAAAFHARGELACSSIELDGRLAAWDLSLLHQGRVFLLKTAYDEEFRKLAPGLVLRLSVIEDCFERGLAAHELLGHVDDWKPKFATTERRHVEAQLFAGGAGFARARLVEAARRRIRSVRRS